jgi:hypothetical protein
MDWIIRKWRNQDAKNLANALNNKKIQANLRDGMDVLTTKSTYTSNYFIFVIHDCKGKGFVRISFQHALNKICGVLLSNQDAKNLANALNNKKIQANLRDGLPYPYTEQDAADFIQSCLAHSLNF